MSFCCGADMLLTIATIRQEGVAITNVPIVFCPVCEQLRVHPSIEFEFEMLKEFACKDRAQEVDLQAVVHPSLQQKLYDPQYHLGYGNLEQVIKEQIDCALDLYTMAHSLGNSEWQEEIVHRLKVLQNKKTKTLNKSQ
jgi:hypothetical protein